MPTSLRRRRRMLPAPDGTTFFVIGAPGNASAAWSLMTEVRRRPRGCSAIIAATPLPRAAKSTSLATRSETILPGFTNRLAKPSRRLQPAGAHAVHDSSAMPPSRTCIRILITACDDPTSAGAGCGLTRMITDHPSHTGRDMFMLRSNSRYGRRPEQSPRTPVPSAVWQWPEPASSGHSAGLRPVAHMKTAHQRSRRSGDGW